MAVKGNKVVSRAQKERILANRGIAVIPKTKGKLTNAQILELRKLAEKRNIEKKTIAGLNINEAEVLKGLRLTTRQQESAKKIIADYKNEMERYLTGKATQDEASREFNKNPEVAKLKAIWQTANSSSGGLSMFVKLAPRLGISVKDFIGSQILTHGMNNVGMYALHKAGISYPDLYKATIEEIKSLRKGILRERKYENYDRMQKEYLRQITEAIDAEDTLRKMNEVSDSKITNPKAKDIRQRIKAQADYTSRLNDYELSLGIRRSSSNVSLDEINTFRDANVPVDYLLRCGLTPDLLYLPNLKSKPGYEHYGYSKAQMDRGISDFRKWFKQRENLLSDQEKYRCEAILNIISGKIKDDHRINIQKIGTFS